MGYEEWESVHREVHVCTCISKALLILFKNLGILHVPTSSFITQNQGGKGRGPERWRGDGGVCAVVVVWRAAGLADLAP